MWFSLFFPPSRESLSCGGHSLTRMTFGLGKNFQKECLRGGKEGCLWVPGHLEFPYNSRRAPGISPIRPIRLSGRAAPVWTPVHPLRVLGVQTVLQWVTCGYIHLCFPGGAGWNFLVLALCSLHLLLTLQNLRLWGCPPLPRSAFVRLFWLGHWLLV